MHYCTRSQHNVSQGLIQPLHGNVQLKRRVTGLFQGLTSHGQPVSHLSSEGGEGLDEHGGLQGHVEAAGDTCALQGLGLTVQLPHLHQTGHLVLRDFNSLTPPIGQADVS